MLVAKKNIAERLARWCLYLQDFDIKIIHRNGKTHTDADTLSWYPIEEDVLDEEDYRLLSLQVEIPKGSAAGIPRRYAGWTSGHQAFSGESQAKMLLAWA